MDRAAEEHYPVLQQSRIDVVRALAAAGLLDHHWNQQTHRINHTIVAAAPHHPPGARGLAGKPEALAEENLAHDVAIDDLTRLAVEQNLTRVNHIGTVDDRQSRVDVVVGDHDADAALLEVGDDALDFDHGDGVDAGEGLVEAKEHRIEHQRASYLD